MSTQATNLGSRDDDGTPTFTAMGGDWTRIAEDIASLKEERIVVNMGPQHPSTHGVLRLILELDGETVTEARAVIGYLHTGIEKSMEWRNWTQGVTFCTRMDYVMSMHNELAYCLGVEKLLDITDQIPERATVIRVMMSELTRISSHLVFMATGGLEMGATTIMENGFSAREVVLRLIEMTTGLRMNNAYIRPGGVAQDTPPGFLDAVREGMTKLPPLIWELELLANENPVIKARMCDVGFLDLAGCMALGITGPILRSTGLPYDLRKAEPYCGYETYDFDIPTWDSSDAYGRFRVRVAEMYESIRIIRQCADRLQGLPPGEVMVADKKIAWPAQLTLGSDGLGNSLDHIRHIMGTSMEALIHHFKIVTEGFRVPAGQVYQAIESAKGELGVHLVSDGGTKPYRAHFRDPSFNNLQALSAMAEGGSVADIVVAIASIDPVLGGVDR